MKKYLYILPIVFAVALILFIIPQNRDLPDSNTPTPVDEVSNEQNIREKDTASTANPASKYCEENGGELEIVSNNDGSQFGLCKLEDYSCEGWTYFRGECDIEGDAEKIRKALIAQGLNLTGMKVVIHKHLGKHIGGGVVPVDMLGGGGYVFAVKDDGGNIKIVADGNGAIMCTMLENYPDFSTYLIPECIDEMGNPISR